MRYYGYEEFKTDVNELAKEILAYKPDTLLAIARGGCTLAHFLSNATNIRSLYTLNSIHYDDTKKLETVHVFNIPDLSNAKKVVLVDDMVDSGETMIEIKRILLEKFPHVELKVATIFYKKTSQLMPDFTRKETTDWIEFFWDFRIDQY